MKNKPPKNWSQNKSSNCAWYGSIIKVLLLGLLLPTFGCVSNISEENTTPTQDTIALDNAVWEQSNSTGETLWRIQADRTVYSPDKKIAYLDRIVANVLQDGEIILRLKAEKGEIHKNGAEIYLKEKILAADTRNNTVIQAELGTWYPGQELLIIEKNLSGTHPNLKIWAKVGRYYSGQQRLELEGEIVAEMSDPTLKMKAEYIYWEIPQKKAIVSASPNSNSSNSQPEIYHYRDNIIVDRVAADSIEIDLAKNTATFAKNASFQHSDPPVEIVTNTATWHYQKDLVTSETPIRIVHSEKQLTIIGNQGQVDLKEKIATLKGGVKGINNRDRSQLFSDVLIWNITPGIVQGIGNVSYQQTDPKFQVSGTNAVGQLANNDIVVTGNKTNPTVTKIYP